MTRIRGPPKEKLLPNTHPELDLPTEYAERYIALRNDGMNQTQALERIGEQYGISRPAVWRYICASYRDWEKNYKVAYTQKKRADPNWRGKERENNARRMHARYHIDEYIAQAFSHAQPQTELTLAELTDYVHQVSQVRFRPSSLLTMNRKYEEQHGTPLVERVEGEIPKYRRFVSHS